MGCSPQGKWSFSSQSFFVFEEILEEGRSNWFVLLLSTVLKKNHIRTDLVGFGMFFFAIMIFSVVTSQRGLDGRICIGILFQGKG